MTKVSVKRTAVNPVEDPARPPTKKKSDLVIIKIKTGHGVETRTARKSATPGLVVHLTVNSDHDYSLTHEPSGMGLCSNFRSRQSAMAAAKKLGDLSIDWTVGQDVVEALPEETLKAIVEILRDERARGYGQ